MVVRDLCWSLEAPSLAFQGQPHAVSDCGRECSLRLQPKLPFPSTAASSRLIQAIKEDERTLQVVDRVPEPERVWGS